MPESLLASINTIPINLLSKFCCICDATIPYTYFSLPYAGKPEIFVGDAAKYYITGTDKYSKYLVNDLFAPCKMQGYFKSVSLASKALKKNITIVGTMRHDRKGIPKELKSVAKREEKSVMYIYHTKEKKMVTSYIDKKKSGKENFIVLSSIHESVKVTKDQRKKPSVHSMYDHTKGGVDVVDLLSTSHSTRIKCKRWPWNAFAFILDNCRSNAKTILQDKRIKMSNFEFTYSIGESTCSLCNQKKI